MTNKSHELSRRDFCKHSTAFAASAVVFITLGPRLAAAQSLMTQQQVSYQDTPKGTQQCINCKLFAPPNACRSVEGNISPQGWCTIFQPTT
jgi:hypothetical protein